MTTNLFQSGSFVLHSGAKSAWKIECDALTDEDWEALALMIVERVKPFASVRGIPRGGIKLAKALEPYRTFGNGTLIVDDVLTTGNSMERARRGRDSAQGAVIFSRGECPDWITPLFQMSSHG